jgi:hypothetical protein
VQCYGSGCGMRIRSSYLSVSAKSRNLLRSAKF